MIDLTELPDDDLAASFRAHFLEVESRIDASDHAKKGKLLTATKGAHALMERVGAILVASGDVSADSVGGDKP